MRTGRSVGFKSPSSPSSSALPSRSSSNIDAVADNTTTIPVHDARPRTHRSVDTLPPTTRQI